MLSPERSGLASSAILAGLVGAYLIRGTAWLRSRYGLRRLASPRTVPLAAVDLPAGRVLTVGDVGLYTMTVEEMNKLKIDRTRAMMAPEQIIGRIVKEPIKRGQPFLSITSLFLEGGHPNIGARLRPGLRALQPAGPQGAREAGSEAGAFVATCLYAKPVRLLPRGEYLSQALPIPELTVMLMSGVEIVDVYQAPAPRSNPMASSSSLGAHERSIERPRRRRLMTLAVTPDQASKLQAVMGRGDITLVGRPVDEKPDALGRRPANISVTRRPVAQAPHRHAPQRLRD